MASPPWHCYHVYCSCEHCCCGHYHGYHHCGITAMGHCCCGCNFQGQHCCGLATMSGATRSVTTAVASPPWALPPLAWPPQTLLLWMFLPWVLLLWAIPLWAPLLCTSPLWGYFHMLPWASPAWHCSSGTGTAGFAAVDITALASPLWSIGIAAMTSSLQAPSIRALGIAWGSGPPRVLCRRGRSLLQLCPAWHHLALPCLGAHRIPKGGALGPWVPLCVGTGTWSGSAVPVTTPAAAGGRVRLCRGFH